MSIASRIVLVYSSVKYNEENWFMRMTRLAAKMKYLGGGQ
jgi:hypothetical protein